MTKVVGMQYVKEFEFPTEQGFSGSAGKSSVKGYMRGGHVKGKYDDPGPMPKNVKSHGGTVGVTTTQSKQMPQKARQGAAAKKSAKKMHGGKMSMHDKLYHEGGKMGYAKGGYASSMNTDAEFLMKTSKQDTMDHGIYPAQSTTAADKEAGGRPRLKPKFKYGGKVHTVRDVSAKSRRKASGSKMPKGVKNRGGLARYADGGYTSEDLGGGAAGRSAEAAVKRQKRSRSTIDKALAASNRAMGVKDKPPEPSATSSTPKVESWAMPRAYDKDFKISHEHAVGGPVTARHGGMAKKRGAAR